MITTTHGSIIESQLARTVGFEDRPKEFVVWVEWRLLNHDGKNCVVCARQQPELPAHIQERAIKDSVLVRRDAHVILKEPSVTADAIVAGL